jgi:hypothetical protein
MGMTLDIAAISVLGAMTFFIHFFVKRELFWMSLDESITHSLLILAGKKSPDRKLWRERDGECIATYSGVKTLQCCQGDRVSHSCVLAAV